MCTAVALNCGKFYFGRTLDNHCSYGEEAVVTPRSFRFDFRCGQRLLPHYALIGTACVKGGYPLYYEAMNEKGLCMAGLNFVGNAKFYRPTEGKLNLAQFELLPYILGKADSVKSALSLLKEINLVNTPFDDKTPVAELHYMIADRNGAVTVEFVKDGLKIYKNRAGVLTNNPPFDIQIFNLNNYLKLSPEEPKNKFLKGLKPYSLGMGAFGLPGDLSSQSRFVRAAFLAHNAVCPDKSGVSTFFHVLNGVEQPLGCCKTPQGGYEHTVYSSCMCAEEGVYYFSTYGCRRIRAVSLSRCRVDGDKLIRFPHGGGEDVNFLN